MLFTCARNPTVITVDPKDHLTLVAPFLRASGREAVSRFVEELRVYAVRMASHASSRPRSSSSSRSRPPSAEAEKAEIPTDQFKPQTDDRRSISIRSHADPSTTVPQTSALEEDNPEQVHYNLLSNKEDAEATAELQASSTESVSSKTNINNFTGLRSFSSLDYDDLAALISPHLPHTISPEVLETFMVMENVDPNDPDSIARYLISCGEVEDTSEVYLQLERLRLNLNSSSASDAIAAYTTAFLKILRLAPSFTDSKSKLHFFINGIRPDAVKRILKHDMRNEDIQDLPELISRLKELLPRYHLPYSEFYSFNKRSSAPGPRNIDQQSYHSRPSSRFSSRLHSNQSHPKHNRNPSFRTPRNPRTSSTSSKTPIKSASKSSQDVVCRFCKQPGHMIKDCPDPSCRVSQQHKSDSQPRYRNPREPVGRREIPTRKRNPQLNSIISSIQDGIKEDHDIDHTYLPIYVTHSPSSSESETSYNVTLNPLINFDNYSDYSSASPSSPLSLEHFSDSDCFEFANLFENLDLITCPSYPSSDSESPAKPSRLNSSSSFVSTPLSRVAKEASISDEFRPTTLRTDTSSLVPLGKAPGSSNKSLSLEANPDLDSDYEPVHADCARHNSGVTGLGNSVTKRSNLNRHDNKVPSTTTNPCHPSDSSHASVVIPNPKITIPLKELNKPMDRKLLHLRIFAGKDQIIYGMIDTGATISCISRDLVKVARLKPTGSSLKLNLADNNSVECQLVSGTLAFALGGTAKLIYVSTTLAVLDCPNSCPIGCDLLKSLGLLTNNYLFINLTERNLSIQDENAVPDQFMPPALTVSTAVTLPDLDKAKFLLDDSTLTQNIKDLLLKYPQIFFKLPDSRGIDCPPMTIEFYDESEIVSKNARYLPPDKLRIANEQIDLLIEHGFAVPYDGPFSFPICLVQAPGKPPRLTGDYSGSDGINAKTVPIPADLPRISDVCRFPSNATYIATLDLPKAFWQLNLHPDHQPKTAISIPGRKVMFTRASFGLKNVPAIFQNLMKRIFNIDGIFIYMDDLILAADSKPEFLARLDKLFALAQQFRVRIGLHKCAFQTKDHPIKLSPPTSVPELRSFVGSINFIRDWLPSVSAELAPLTALLQKKPKKIKLGEKEIKCFENIKTMLINSTPLALPDANSTILISTNASDKAIVGIIWKELEPSPPGTCLSKRKVAPVSFYSRILTASQRNWSTMQKKLFAIVMTRDY
ncbi:hypothetical protein P9112_004577 [Eukaryota sp. TZLM1-RC]